MRIRALHQLLVDARELCDLILQRQERAPVSRPGQTEIEGKKRKESGQLEWRGGKNWKQGNGKGGKHQKFKAPLSNISSHWDSAWAVGGPQASQEQSGSVYHNIKCRYALTQPSLLRYSVPQKYSQGQRSVFPCFLCTFVFVTEKSVTLQMSIHKGMFEYTMAYLKYPLEE